MIVLVLVKIKKSPGWCWWYSCEANINKLTSYNGWSWIIEQVLAYDIEFLMSIRVGTGIGLQIERGALYPYYVFILLISKNMRNVWQHVFSSRPAKWSCYSMQVCAGIIMLVVGGLDINNHAEQRIAIILNDVTLIMVFVILLINVVTSGFGMEHSSTGLREVRAPPK